MFQKWAILAYFDPKLPFLSLKLLQNYFYIQNMDEITLRQVGPEKSKFSFFAISGSSKIIAYTNIQIHVTRSILIVNWFFLKCSEQCLLSQSITIVKSKKHLFMGQRSPLSPLPARSWHEAFVIVVVVGVALRCTFSTLSMFCLMSGNQNCTAHSRCGQTSDLYWGRIISLFLYLKLRAMNTSTMFAVLQLFSVCFFYMMMIPRSLCWSAVSNCWLDILYVAMYFVNIQRSHGHDVVAMHAVRINVQYWIFFNIEVHLKLVCSLNQQHSSIVVNIDSSYHYHNSIMFATIIF